MKIRRRSLIALVALLVFPAMLAPRGADAARAAEEELLQGAAQRIEEHRKSDAAIVIVDASGKPLPDVKVTVEQTRHGFLFGCNFFQFGKFRDQQDEDAYRNQFAELFNYATLAFYWPSYESRQGSPQHAYTEEVAKWCRDHGIAAKGHPLAWNYFEPRWLPDDLLEVRRLQMERITDCVTRFRGLIDVWDVVNEATHYERDELQQRAPKMTRMWTDAGRVPFVNECFRHARAANEQATLIINDYRVDPAYAQLIKDMTQQAGQRPFDVIGIQSHMHGEVWSNEKIWDACERFAPFDVPLHFTELTILSGALGWERTKEGKPWPSTPEGEAQQAKDVARVYTMLFSHPAVAAITWWDFADRNAWQRAPAGLVGQDLKPKPAYTALKDLITSQWWTRTELTTNAEGRAAFRGFHGEYQVSVRLSSGKDIQAAHTLKKGEGNVWEIRVEDGTGP
jgi:endo-1,4-beta-xylanase